MKASMSPDPDDSRQSQLSAFDESLRSGITPAASASTDAEQRELERLLVQLNSAWPHKDAKTICGYPIIRVLGQGAIGPCYLVKDLKRNEPMVLRILWPELAGNGRIRETILGDAMRLRELTIRGIVSVKEAGKAGAVCYVASNYLLGQSLAEWRSRHATTGVPWQPVLRFIARVSAVLGSAHDLGLSHGNLKPSNIFLTGDKPIPIDQLGECDFRITELGLTRALHAAGRSALAGLPWPSPQYLPPEQSSAHPPSPAGDVYALGVMLYELLTARSPVHGTTRDEIAKVTRHGKPSSPIELGVAISPEVNDLVMLCLDKVPANRPATGNRLAGLLMSLLEPKEPPAPAPWWKQWLGWM